MSQILYECSGALWVLTQHSLCHNLWSLRQLSFSIQLYNSIFSRDNHLLSKELVSHRGFKSHVLSNSCVCMAKRFHLRVVLCGLHNYCCIQYSKWLSLYVAFGCQNRQDQDEICYSRYSYNCRASWFFLVIFRVFKACLFFLAFQSSFK